MNTKIGFIIVIVLSLIGLCHVAPASSVIDAFKLGVERSYSLTNEVALNDLRTSGSPVSYKLTGTVKVGTIWGNDAKILLKFELISPKLHVKPKNSLQFSEQYSPLDSVEQNVFYAQWNMGRINKIYTNKDDNLSTKNLNKGIASLFQYQLLDGFFKEDDVSGSCDVHYVSKSSSRYVKTKSNCKSNDADYHFRSDKPIGLNTHSTRTAEYFVTPEGVLEKVESNEYHKIEVAANGKAGSSLESKFSLKFDGSISDITTLKSSTFKEAVEQLIGYEKSVLMSDQENQCKGEGCLSLKELVKSYKESLSNENVGKKESSLAMVKLVPAARITSQEDLLRILKARSTQEIKGQLFDLFGATQTKESHEAVKEVLNLISYDDFHSVERYLQALSIGTRPREDVINDLLNLLKEQPDYEKLKDTFVQTVSAMGRRFSQLPTHSYETKVVKKVETYLLNSLSQCKDNDCKKVLIRGLQNLLSPTTIPVLLKNAEKEDTSVSVTAMKALREFSASHWTSEIKKRIENIFYQKSKRFDSSARTLALDILFEMRPNLEELTNILGFLKSNDKSFEIKQYLLQKIKMISEQCSEFRSKISTILKSDVHLNNYNVIGQKGLTTALSRTFSKKPSFNASLVSIQEINSGVLKRGIVDMKIESGENEFSVFTLGIYAGGLSSFIGGSDDSEPVEDEPATAGMEITVQGSYLRPLEFFKGQGELMGHVWSGTGSDPTAAYQATTLLHDHQEYIRLQNGGGFSLNVIGALSVDLNGQISFSLWNRNAKSEVRKNIALAVAGRISLDTFFINLDSEFTITQEPKLNLKSDIDFYTEIMLCMQLSQPETVLSHQITKSEFVPESRHKLKKIANISYNLPGNTHALNQKNNEMCNKIFKS